MHTVQHRHDRNDIMLGCCSTYGHDCCNGLCIPDFDLGWKVSAVQGIIDNISNFYYSVSFLFFLLDLKSQVRRERNVFVYFFAEIRSVERVLERNMMLMMMVCCGALEAFSPSVEKFSNSKFLVY